MLSIMCYYRGAEQSLTGNNMDQDNQQNAYNPDTMNGPKPAGWNGMKMWHNDPHGHHMLRWLVGLILLIIVFCFGVKIGEFKSELEHGSFMHGYGDYEMMHGEGQGATCSLNDKCDTSKSDIPAFTSPVTPAPTPVK